MPFLLGTDEAGYGPNLGPLVVSATLWHVPAALAQGDLYEAFGDGVTASPKTSSKFRDRAAPAQPLGSSTPLAIADSKRLYQAGGSLAPLERGVLAALALLGPTISTWRQLWQTLDPQSAAYLGDFPWYATYDCELPLAVAADEIHAAAARFASVLQSAQTKLVSLRSAIVLPPVFNTQVAKCDSKGSLLSQTTLALAAELLALCGDEPVLAICDKHGGRNKYGPLLQTLFPEYLVEILAESRGESVYRWGPRDHKVTFIFRAKGERFLPAALASMACKYVRELAMQAENHFWQQHVRGLRPTAGYPEDARRFKAEIASQQAALQIADHLLWRCR